MATEDAYLERLEEILNQYPTKVTKEGPTQVNNFLYIGSYEDARDRKKLAELGITHVLNCAAWNSKNPYIDHPTVARYKQFFADDTPDYDMLQHVRAANAFIDEGRRWKGRSGRVLVHCALGVNRSGLIVAAYMMCDRRSSPADTVRMLKLRRGMILTNPGFQRQLIELAREKKLIPALR